MVGLSPADGSVTFNPTRGRGLGADDMVVTAAGLWVASDNQANTSDCGGVWGRSGLCFFPYPNPGNAAPTAVFTASCTDLTCSFDGRGSSDPDGTVAGYAWDFGDGQTGSGATVSHTYATAKTYTVTLTVVDNLGAGSAPATSTVTVTKPPPPGAGFQSVAPCRVFDTRTGTGTCTGIASPASPKAPVGADSTLSVKLAGVAGVPSTATAVVLNVTAVNASQATFVTVAPNGPARPGVSNLNVANGSAVPNLVTVPLGTNGLVDFYNSVGHVDLVADLAGYYVSGASSRYTALAPCRVFDTRTGTGACTGSPAQPVPAVAVGPGQTIKVKVTGLAGVPANATAVVMNVTAVGASLPTFVTAWPDGVTQPTASNLNVSNRQAIANLVVVSVGAGGYVDLYNSTGSVQLLADLAGYFSPGGPSGLVATGPCRVFDTRTGTGTCSGLPTPAVVAQPLNAHTTLRIKVTGVAGVPANATAVILNVTAQGATANTFVTVWPDATNRPGVSNLNVSGGFPVPNLVMVRVGAGGYVDLYNDQGSVNLFADLSGYFVG
jgi:PKD repeat protein